MPPACGIMAANSPYDRAAATVDDGSEEPRDQNPARLPIFRAISAVTMKMPEPIIDPTTSIVASKRPSSRMKPVD